MAKELPYFKFEPAEWMTGRISLENFEAQGAFLNLCCLYWQRLGDVKEKEARLRLKDNFDLLKDAEMFGITSGKLTIKFLDIQLSERLKISKERSEIGRKGGLAKAKQLPSKSQAVGKQNRIEENRKDILLQKSDWKNGLCKNLSISNDELERFIPEFIGMLDLSSNWDRPNKEIRTHLFNWIKKQPVVKNIKPKFDPYG